MRSECSKSRVAVGAWIGGALLCAVSQGVLADSLLSFDSSKGSCRLIEVGGIPAVECDAAANPSMALGSAAFARESRDGKVLFAFPDAKGKPVRITPSGGAWAISWGEETPRLPAGAATSVTPTLANRAPAPPGTVPQPEEDDLAPTPNTTVTTTTQPAGAGTGASLTDTLIDLVKAKIPAAKQSDYVYDYGIPESPGFIVLGLTPANVDHPRTIRDFVLSLKDGVDEAGHFKAGLALDFSPLQILAHDESLEDYLDVDRIQKEMSDARKRGAQPPRPRLLMRSDQILTNTTVSLASSQGTGDEDKSVNLGIGLHIPLIDKSDLRDWMGRCYEGGMREAVFGARVVDVGGLPSFEPGVAEKIEAEAQNCFEASKKQARWNASVWTVSLGYALSSETGDFGSIAPANRGAWSSFAYGFENGPRLLEKYGQLVLHAKALYKEQVTDPDDASLFIEQNSTTVGLAFRLGKPNFNAALQASFARLKDRTHDTTDEVHRLSVGLEYRIKPDLWLVATVGGEGGRANGVNNSFVLGGLKFGSATNPMLDPTKP